MNDQDKKKIEKTLQQCSKKIENLKGGKSDIGYHSTRNSLHGVWTQLYLSVDPNKEKMEEVNASLAKLEEKAAENEQKKYLNYYVRKSGQGGCEEAICQSN